MRSGKFSMTSRIKKKDKSSTKKCLSATKRRTSNRVLVISLLLHFCMLTFDLLLIEQHALRLTAFRQLHKVLGIDPLPAGPKFRRNRGGRSFKRRREDSGQEEGAKKEKKEGEGEVVAEAMEVTSASGTEVKTDA